MLGYIEGVVLNIESDSVIVKLKNGLGYELRVNQKMKNIQQNEIVGLYISTIVRENTFDLYAHLDMGTKQLFELLLSVKGIGPKLAFKIVETITWEDLQECVLNEKPEILTNVPGLGKRGANQIILDFKNAKKFQSIRKFVRPDIGQKYLLQNDLQFALQDLGISPEKGQKAISKVLAESSKHTTESALREILNELR